MVTTSFSMDASTIKFAIGQVQGTYEGKLSADGASITGTWTQGRPLPLDFHRRYQRNDLARSITSPRTIHTGGEERQP
jgi:hypothetical protein